MNIYPQKYLYGDHRFPALAPRLDQLRRFQNAPRDTRFQAEGIFNCKSTPFPEKTNAYVGYIDLNKEFELLGIKAPSEDLARVWCYIPSELVKKEDKDKIISEQYISIYGRVRVKGNIADTKHIEVDTPVEFKDLEYRCVGAPFYENLEEIFQCIYSRTPEIHEYSPMLLLAGIISSRKRRIFPIDENVGCGVNIGMTEEVLPGKVSGNRITNSIQKNLFDFIRKVDIGTLKGIPTPLKWSRYLEVDNPKIISRTMITDKEIDWNLITAINKINNPKQSEFLTSDINLVFDPNLFPRKLKKEDEIGLKQTILYAKSIPVIAYPSEVRNRINEEITLLKHELVKRSEYALFLFRDRLEPLCDAYLKGSLLEYYSLDAGLGMQKKIIKDFFQIAKDAKLDFIDYIEPNIDTNKFDKYLEGTSDKDVLNLIKEMWILGGMTENQMVCYLTGDSIYSEKILSLDKARYKIISAINAGLIYKIGEKYYPVEY